MVKHYAVFKYELIYLTFFNSFTISTIMKLYTLDVGQGAFGVLVGDDEAIIIDTYVPSTVATDNFDLPNIYGALSTILEGKYLIGLIITGFDSDHFNIKGMNIILKKYRPDWIVYPKYFKETENANEIFNFLNEYKMKRDEQRKKNAANKPFKKIPIRIDRKSHRNKSNLSDEWNFEFFSPHWNDMHTSNNCSLVAKITAKEPQKHHFSYLITGDTENGRWDSIVRNDERISK